MKKLLILAILSIFLLNSCGLMMYGPGSRRFKIISNPPGATVYRNGKNTGKTTPCKLKARRSECEILLKKNGYADSNTKLSRDNSLFWTFIWIVPIAFSPIDMLCGSMVSYNPKDPDETIKFKDDVKLTVPKQTRTGTIITFNLLSQSEIQYRKIEKDRQVEAERMRIANEKLKADKAEKEKWRKLQIITHTLDVSTIGDMAHTYAFSPDAEITYEEFLKWEKENNGLSEKKSHFYNDTLFDRYTDKICYIGEFDNSVKILHVDKNFLITVTNLRSGKGIYTLNDGKIAGNWIDNKWDRSSFATLYYDNGTKKVGYFGSQGFSGRYGNETSNWVFLGDNKQDAETYYQNLLIKQNNYYNESVKSAHQESKAKDEFIEQNSSSIFSKVKSEKMNYDAGNYKRYTIEFTDGQSGDLRYYPDNGEWCHYSMFLSDYCIKGKGKAFCRLYWDLTH